MIALRPNLGHPFELHDGAAHGTLVIRRGQYTVAVNLSDEVSPAPNRHGSTTELVIEARPGDGADLGVVPPHAGWIARCTP